MTLKIFRKCKKCKNKIDLNSDNFLYIKEKFIHTNCFIENELNKKRNKLSREEWEQKTQELYNQEKDKINIIFIKAKLYYWLQINYNVVVIPKYFFTKMESIFDGTYQGLLKAIPPIHILDMWEKQKKELDNINAINVKKNKMLKGIQRIQYDLAILLNKYDDYLQWKQNQMILENEYITIQKDNNSNNKNNKNLNDAKINFNKINKIVETQQQSESNNIYDILDEVF